MQLAGKYKNYIYIGLMLLFTAVFITICSENSFLYKMNVWGDVNIYYTVAKSMLKGKVLYRDIYDQKGLYLFAIHMLAVLISDSSYIGMYLFELLFGFTFAISMYKILGLFMPSAKRKAIYVTIIMLLLYISPSFCQGDSAEEMTLPLFGISMYFIIRSLKNHTTMKWWEVALSGAFAGIAIFIKFTLVAFYIPFCLFIFFTAIKDKRVGKAFLYVLYFLLGLGLASAPVFIYFGMNNALPDLWEGYFYNNLFLYSTAESHSIFVVIGSFLTAYISSFVNSYPIYPLIVLGFIYMIINKEYKDRLHFFIISAYVLINFFIFIGGRKYNYYSMPMNVFTWYGIVQFDKHILPRFVAEMRAIKKPMVVLGAVLPTICFFLNGNTYHIFRAREDYHQFQFAEIINQEENPTLLNYGFLDMGLFFLCDIEPNSKYFTTINVDLPEMHEEQENGIKNGQFTFVVTRGKKLDESFDKYELVSEARSEYGTRMHNFYLYKLV